MQSEKELEQQLLRIDHKSYPAYKALRGAYRFDGYEFYIDHVQGDPFAAPSQVHVFVNRKQAGFPVRLIASHLRQRDPAKAG